MKTDRDDAWPSSLEARSPLLDTALLSYVASLPPAHEGELRGAQAALAQRRRDDLLPREIVTRRKHGFGVPVGRWFRE